jgi:Bacterial sugar transferase
MPARRYPPWAGTARGERSIAERYSRLARERAGGRDFDVALRTLDVFLSGLFLVLLLPLTLAIAALVFATSGRPLFYRGERLGPYLGPELVERMRAETTWVGARLDPARRDPAALERPPRRHEPRRATADPAALLRGARLELPAYWQRLVVRPGVTGFA